MLNDVTTPGTRLRSIEPLSQLQLQASSVTDDMTKSMVPIASIGSAERPHVRPSRLN